MVMAQTEYNPIRHLSLETPKTSKILNIKGNYSWWDRMNSYLLAATFTTALTGIALATMGAGLTIWGFPENHNIYQLGIKILPLSTIPTMVWGISKAVQHISSELISNSHS